METEMQVEVHAPSDGDWCMVDLSDDIPERATNWAHAMGMNFEAFMCLALEEKMARLAEDAELKAKMESIKWIAPLSVKNLSDACCDSTGMLQISPRSPLIRRKAE